MPRKHVETSQTGFQGQSHHLHGEHLKVHRVNDGFPTDKSHYLAAAFVELYDGKPIPAHIIAPGVVHVIEGEIHVVDNANPDKTTKLVAGDVIHFEEGTSNITTTPSKAKIFGVTYVPSHLHPDDQVVEKH